MESPAAADAADVADSDAAAAAADDDAAAETEVADTSC